MTDDNTIFISDVEELVSLFSDNKLPKLGTILVFGDSVGKPGDRISELKDIIFNEVSLIFEFNSERILISNPVGIKVSSGKICVQSCSSLKWELNDYYLQYIPKEHFLETVQSREGHVFSTSISEDAFCLYSW